MLSGNMLPLKIHAIFLYGSYATKKQDKYSDIDILVISKNKLDEKSKKKLQDILYSLFDNPKTIDFSIYDNNKFQDLLNSGALFLHHLKNEAVLIYPLKKTKGDYFNNLKEFKGLSEDILLYNRMLKTISISIDKNDMNFFDLYMLGIITRNTLTVLNYYRNPETCKFGKHDVWKSIENKNLKLTLEDYMQLLKYKSFFKRGYPYMEIPNSDWVQSIISAIDNLVLFARKTIGVNDTIDRIHFLIDDNHNRNFYTSFEIFTDIYRNLYIYLKNYAKQKYKIDILSLRVDYLTWLSYKYKNDNFFELTLKLINHIESIKEDSDSYSIEIPTIGSINGDFIKDLEEYRKLRDIFLKLP